MTQLAPTAERATASDLPCRALPDGSHMGPVHLAATDAEKALAIWRDVVGLDVLDQTGSTLTLGAGRTPLVILYADAKAPVTPKTTGLYHLALHVPNRVDLAHFLVRAVKAGVRVSPTDHLVTEAIYLWDLDGNGIEMTFETPWRGTLGNPAEGENYGITIDGKPHSGREPLDVDSLLAEMGAETSVPARLPEGTRIGHVHVHVNDLDQAMAFYAGVVGFERVLLLPRWGMGDAGLGYQPHAIAFNIWSGRNASPPPEGTAGLRFFTLFVPDRVAHAELVDRLTARGFLAEPVQGGVETRDPSGNRLRILFEKD